MFISVDVNIKEEEEKKNELKSERKNKSKFLSL